MTYDALQELIDERDILRATISRLTEEREGLRKALEPFAAYAVGAGKMPDDLTITLGSPLAKRQLTIGDCKRARAALATPSDPDADGARG